MATRLLKKVTDKHFGHAIKAEGLPERIVVKDEQGRLVLLTKPAHTVHPTVDDYEAKGFVVVPDGESKALRREGWLALINANK